MLAHHSTLLTSVCPARRAFVHAQNFAVLVRDTLISGNSAVSSADSNAGRGGGVMAQSVKTLTMINVTVTGNTAGDSGGGLAVTGGAVGLLSSDISSNTINTGSCTDGKIFANEFFSTGSAFFPTICTDATDTSGSGFCLGDSALTACASPPSSPPFSVPAPPAVPPRPESLCIDRCGGITCLALNAPPHNWKCETVEASCKGCGSDAACSPAASDYPAASYAALEPETALFGAMKYGACYGVTSEFVVSGALSTWTSDPDGYPDYARRALLTTVERTAAIRSAFAAAANALSFDVTPRYKTFNSDYTTIKLDIEFMTSDQASAASSALASGAFASTQALEQVIAAEGLSISVLEITVAPGQFGCEAVCHTKSCTGYDAQIKTMCGLCPAKECGTVFGETCCNPGSSDWPLETWGNSWVYRCCETSDDCPTGQFCASECAMYGKCEQEAYVCYPCSYGFLGGAVREADILVPGTTSCALAEAGETLGMTRHELTSDPMSCDQACSAERTYSLHNATCKAVSAPDATSNPMGFCGASGIWPGRWQYKCPDGTFAEGTTGRPDDAPQGKGCHPQLACCDGNTERDMSAVCPEGTYHAGRCGDCAPCGTCCGEYVRSDLPLGHPAKHCPAGTAGAGTCGFGDVPGNICDPKPSGLASAFTWLNATGRLAVYGFVAFVSLSILLAAYKLHIVDKRPQGAKVCKKVPAAAINFGLFLTLPQMVVNLLASIEGAESGDVRVPFAVVAVLGTVDFGFKFWHLWAIDRKDASGRKEMTNQTKARLRFIYGDHMTRSKHDFWHSWLKATVALWQLLFTIYGVLLFIMLASLDELGQANLLGVKKTWGGIFDGNGGLLVTSVSGVVSKRQFQVTAHTAWFLRSSANPLETGSRSLSLPGGWLHLGGQALLWSRLHRVWQPLQDGSQGPQGRQRIWRPRLCGQRRRRCRRLPAPRQRRKIPAGPIDFPRHRPGHQPSLLGSLDCRRPQCCRLHH